MGLVFYVVELKILSYLKNELMNGANVLYADIVVK